MLTEDQKKMQDALVMYVDDRSLGPKKIAEKVGVSEDNLKAYTGKLCKKLLGSTKIDRDALATKRKEGHVAYEIAVETVVKLIGEYNLSRRKPPPGGQLDALPTQALAALTLARTSLAMGPEIVEMAPTDRLRIPDNAGSLYLRVTMLTIPGYWLIFDGNLFVSLVKPLAVSLSVAFVCCVALRCVALRA